MMEDGNGETKKKKVLFPPMRRPIIFVCNNHFVKPLRKLKEICKCVEMRSADSHSLLYRLEYISKQKNIMLEKEHLKILIE